MTKKELVNTITEQTKLPRKDVLLVLDSFIDVVTGELIKGSSVKLAGFGSFHVKECPGRSAVHPRTGKPMVIKSHSRISFSSSRALKKAVSHG